jgi:hypothetical protein
MKTIYNTEFKRKGYGQWTIEIEFTDGQMFKVFTTDSQLFDEWSDLEGEDKNDLIEDRFDYKIEDFFNAQN